MRVQHICTSKEFADVLRNGKKTQEKHLSLYIKTSSIVGEKAVGIIVAKKVVPLAVRRNYIKRVIYSFYRQELSGFKQDFKTVVRVDCAIKETSKRKVSDEIRRELGKLFQKTGMK